MANPITWRNIGAPQLDGSTQGLALAGQSFNNAIAALQNTLKGYEATDSANWNQAKNNNTNELMLRLAQLQDPTNAQAQAAGIIGEAQGMGAQVDLASVLRAAQARPAELMDQQNKTWAFKDAQQNQADRPVAATIQALLASGEAGNAREALEAARSNGEIGDVNFARLMAEAGKVQDAAVARNNQAFRDSVNFAKDQAEINLRNAQTRETDAKTSLANAQKRELLDDGSGFSPKKIKEYAQVAQSDLKNVEGALEAIKGNGPFAGKSWIQERKSLDALLNGRNWTDVLSGTASTAVLDKAMDRLKSLGMYEPSTGQIRIDNTAGTRSALFNIPAQIVRDAISNEDGWTDPASSDIAARIEKWATSAETRQAADLILQGQEAVQRARENLAIANQAAAGDKKARAILRGEDPEKVKSGKAKD